MLAAFNGRVQMVKDLRYAKAQYDIKDNGGSTALHWAMDSRSAETIEYMLADGADLKAVDDALYTPLLRLGRWRRRENCVKTYMIWNKFMGHGHVLWKGRVIFFKWYVSLSLF